MLQVTTGAWKDIFTCIGNGKYSVYIVLKPLCSKFINRKSDRALSMPCTQLLASEVMITRDNHWSGFCFVSLFHDDNSLASYNR